MKKKGTVKVKKNRASVGKTGRRLLLIGLFCLVALVLWHMTRDVTKPVAIDHIGNIPVYESFLPEGVPGRPGTKRKVLYIVIHETDNFARTADAEAHSSFLQENCNKEKLSWHYTVDDHQIYHHLPDDEAAYHASDGMARDGGNLNGIGIEMCVNQGGNYEQTVENAVHLTARLLNEYGLSVEDVKMHQDFCGKKCPGKLIAQDRWQEFRECVAAAMG